MMIDRYLPTFTPLAENKDTQNWNQQTLMKPFRKTNNYGPVYTF